LLNSDKSWVVYLVRCSDKSLYCGITNNLEKRLDAHNLGKGAKYTRSRTPVELMGTSSAMTRSDALKLEHRIKRTPANRKLFELENRKIHPEMEKTQIMHEIQKELQAVIKCIQQLSNSVGNIVTAVDQFAKVDSSKGTRGKIPPARK